MNPKYPSHSFVGTEKAVPVIKDLQWMKDKSPN